MSAKFCPNCYAPTPRHKTWCSYNDYDHEREAVLSALDDLRAKVEALALGANPSRHRLLDPDEVLALDRRL